MLMDLIKRNRSYRRFDESVSVPRETLEGLIEATRLSPSAANRQPLKYILSSDPEKNARIFPHLSWAGYLKDWPGPAEGERPSAYIVILGDTEIAPDFSFDPGIAAQSILLCATEEGLGGCMLGAIDRKGLRRDLGIPDRYEILLVIALGKPAEKVVIEDASKTGDIKYWRDDQGVHHVPKRPLSELIIE